VPNPTSALRGLGGLHLFQEISVIPDKEEKDSDVDSPDHEPVDRIGALRIDYLWPVFYLPGLRSLSLFEINTEEAANGLANGLRTSDRVCWKARTIKMNITTAT
jgi:hypothetical protein